MPSFDTVYWPDFRGQGYARTPMHRTIRTPFTTAGDQRKSLASTMLYGYDLAWRSLTKAQAQALYHAQQIAAGRAMYFYEWREIAETNLLIYTGTGAGSVSFQMPGLMKSASRTVSGLTLTKDGVTINHGTDWTYDGTRTGLQPTANAAADIITLSAGINTVGALFRASWTYGRRRRSCRAVSFQMKEREGGSGLWMATARLEEE